MAVDLRAFVDLADERIKDDEGNLVLGSSHYEAAQYPQFLPSWDTKEHFPALKFFKHEDRGLAADPSYPNLLTEAAKVRPITPKLGSEIRGIQLSELSDEGKDELALLVAKRGVVVFRDQDFYDKGPQYVKDYVRYYGPLHIHPTLGAPKGHPELHVVYRRDGSTATKSLPNKNSLIYWHSDVSYELQPPGTTFFGILETPESGGDTLFADTVEAYKRLSPAFQQRLEGLQALHTSHDQAKASRLREGVERRDPVNNVHPLVRVHPVTGEKALYVNANFTRKIVGLKDEESDALLKFLYDHIGNLHDLQIRANYERGTVVVWDNRRVVHLALFDWADEDLSRHAVRVTPQAERPVESLSQLNEPSENNDTGVYTYRSY